MNLQASQSTWTPFDGVQDMLPQDMATWKAEYFKLQELRKHQKQEGHPLCHPPLKQAVKSLHERWPPGTWKKRASLYPRQRDAKKNPGTQGLLSPLSLLHLPPMLWPTRALHTCTPFIRPSRETLWSVYLYSICLYKYSGLRSLFTCESSWVT